MESLGVILKVQEPTDWVHPLVIVNKPNGDVRLCLDPRELNQAIRREHIKLPTSEEIFSELGDARKFTVLDASQAFWQVELDDESSYLCTFGTPWGRYRFLRLPYGVCSAPEVFQSRVNEVLRGLDNTKSFIDDILVWGDEQSHDSTLQKVLHRCRAHNLKLGKKKLQLAKEEVIFMGHKLTKTGVKIEPSKVEAIRLMPSPTCKQELQRYLGMFNYLSKFIPNYSQKTEYLRKLLCGTADWNWSDRAEEDLTALKENVTAAPVLAFYDGEKPVILSVDASSHGLGAVMLQGGRPIAFASVTLTSAQRNYAQIEKELLAVVFACEAFHYYIFGKEVSIETDHKPLIAIHKKPLASLSPRLQRLILRLLRYQVNLHYVPGKFLYIADTLSRAPLHRNIDTSYLEGEAQAVHSLLCVSSDRLRELQEATRQDEPLHHVLTYVSRGWPEHISAVQPDAKRFWPHRNEIHSKDSLLFRGDRVIIPSSLKTSLLARLHCSHQGIVACKAKAREVMYWPGIESLITSCRLCQEHSRSNSREPLMPHEIASRPWEKVGIDFMHLSGSTYIVIIDYFSKFVEIQLLSNSTAGTVISSLKSVFARHGVPSVIVSDNGPPFQSELFKQFCEAWDVTHTTSSPGYPRANGMVERAIQTLKNVLNKASKDRQDLHAVLLEYRTTPLNGLPSPAELLMGRKLRTLLPTAQSLLIPKFQTPAPQAALLKNQRIMKTYADRSTKPLARFQRGQQVLYRQSHRNWQPAVVVDHHHNPRSYVFQSRDGTLYRRNRVDLRPLHLSSSCTPGGQSSLPGQQSFSQLLQLPDRNPSERDTLPPPLSPREDSATSLPVAVSTPKEHVPVTSRVSRFGREIRTPSRFKE